MIKTYAGRKLGVRSAHRKMMLRQMATSLIHYEKITTTEARAKELKAYADRLISKMKSYDTTLRRAREARRWLAPNGYKVEKKLIDTIVPRYAQRTGGHIRIVLLPPRRSDSARLARLELIS